MAQFKKGTVKKGGRLAGTPNKLTTDLRKRIESILDFHFTDELVKKDFLILNSEKRLNIMIKLLEFALPKLRSTELTTDFERMTDEDLEKIINELQNINYEKLKQN